jgi:predicted double-glycine peptidase
VVRDSAWNDHCVAVLEITHANVLIADPAEGLVRIPTAQFLSAWRGCGIILRRPA